MLSNSTKNIPIIRKSLWHMQINGHRMVSGMMRVRMMRWVVVVMVMMAAGCLMRRAVRTKSSVVVGNSNSRRRWTHAVMVVMAQHGCPR